MGRRRGRGQAEHQRDGRPVDVGVDEADGVALLGERHREVGGHRRLAHAAFAAGDGDHAGVGAGAEGGLDDAVPGAQ